MIEKLSSKFVEKSINNACKVCITALYLFDQERASFLRGKLASKESQFLSYLTKLTALVDNPQIAEKIAQIRFLLGVLDYAKKLYPAAMGHFSAIFPRASVYNLMFKYRILTLIEINDTEEVTRSFNCLSKINPPFVQDGRLINRFGIAAFRKENFKLAYQCFTLATRIAPNSPECLKNKEKAFSALSRQMTIADDTVSEVIPLELLGSGSFGEVMKGLQAGIPVAIKKEILPGVMNPNREAAFMHNLHHPNIVELIGVTAGYKTLVMQFAAHGSLYDYLEKNPLCLEEKESITRGIIEGIAHLHNHMIIHRDLKSQNILLDADFRPRIIDFGTAYFSFVEIPRKFKYFKGSMPWLAPESLRSNTYSSASDIYAFAIILKEIMTGEKPLAQLTMPEIFSQVPDGYREPIPPEVPSGIKKLIERSWAPDPRRRPSAQRAHLKLSNLSIFQPQPEHPSSSDSDEEFAAELSSWEMLGMS